MKLTENDLGKFFYIIEYDNEGYIEILRCKLVEIYITEKHKLETGNRITSYPKTGVMLQFRDNYYTPNIKDIYRTLEEVLKAVKIIENNYESRK